MASISQITDNVAELLVKIIEFTQRRQKILTRNINNVHTKGYVPVDMAVGEFCCLLNRAINEHNQCRRLLLCDTENVVFGENGSFRTTPIIDKCASELLRTNPDEYLELQVNKLLENALNQRIAAELLKQKGGLFQDSEYPWC
jgi:flagellar basal body rod protein FlgB